MQDAHVLTGLTLPQLAEVIGRLRSSRNRRGRPWALSLERRVVIGCTSLRTNRTVRELAAMFEISRSQAHRVVVDISERDAALLPLRSDQDRRWSWVVDGTLVPTRDHATAAEAKNSRWSCNAQILVRRADLHVIAAEVGGPGNRNDPVLYHDSSSSACASTTDACSPTAAISASHSSSHPCFGAVASFATIPGVVIAAGALVSNSPSPGSRAGESFEITDAEDSAYGSHSKP